jgi:hypothetical protein
MNLDQISAGDYSSLNGLWQNAAGAKLTISGDEIVGSDGETYIENLYITQNGDFSLTSSANNSQVSLAYNGNSVNFIKKGNLILDVSPTITAKSDAIVFNYGQPSTSDRVYYKVAN